jgi:phosphoribosylformylglycinamidine synthase subunit PurQ / glutaminase
MRIAIIQFPGSNCERETALAVKRAGMTPVSFMWNEAEDTLHHCDGFIIVGGFSYEDRSRSGIIAALDPVMNVIKQQSALGKPVLGICNGAQILVESGMISGNDSSNVSIALAENKRVQQDKVLGTGFYNAWVDIKYTPSCKDNAFNHHMSSHNQFTIPIASAEGRFMMSEATLKSLHDAGQIVFQYCDKDGMQNDEFPTNPNGSIDNIAAISNPAGNVLAIMPHPERTTDGDALFLSMKDYINNGIKAHEAVVTPTPQTQSLPTYRKDDGSYDMVVSTIITDNHAVTVENTLRKIGIAVSVTRQVLWSIGCDSKSKLHQIQASGVLHNEQKEFVDKTSSNQSRKSILVHAKNDWHGLDKLQQLNHHFKLKGIASIQHGILWHIQPDNADDEASIQKAMDSGIFFNPISHQGYDYEQL